MNSWQDWHKILFGLVCGLLAAALVLLVANQPRGTAIELSPVPTTSPISVHVVGAVANPGVYQLAPGSRAEQAVQAAGGFTDEADTQGLNLAAQLADGSKVTVSEIGESIDNPERSTGISSVLVNLNTATIEELMTLPSIGQERAELIIKYRTDHGGFKSTDEIQEVSGIGPATFEKLKDMITVAP